MYKLKYHILFIYKLHISDFQNKNTKQLSGPLQNYYIRILSWWSPRVGFLLCSK